MVRLMRTFAFVTSCAVGSLVLAADVTGTWTASFETQVGQQTYTYELKVEGTTVTGTAKSNLVGDSVLADGKVDGNTITFVENGNYQGMPISFNYVGELVGDEIHFKRTIMDFPPEEFVAKRSN